MQWSRQSHGIADMQLLAKKATYLLEYGATIHTEMQPLAGIHSSFFGLIAGGGGNTTHIAGTKFGS